MKTKFVMLMLAVVTLAGCDNGARFVDCLDGCSVTDRDTEVVVVTEPAPPVDPTLEEEIAAILSEENDYRLGLGQTMLSNGLSCTLSTITGGSRIQSSIAGHNTLTGISNVATFLYKGLFNQPDTSISVGMNVLPEALRSIYKNMYLLRCQGFIVVTESGYYSFELTSDDASLLYVAGAKVIDNDNNHGSVTVTGQKYLRKGVHAFRLDYAQAGGGNQSLILTSGGESINPAFYAH